MICGIICQGGEPGGGGATTWDPAKKHADITLSGGNLIATQTTTGNFRNVKSVAGSLTGKRYFECRLNAATSAAEVVVIGLGTAAASLSNFISQTGGSSYSCGLCADGNAYNGPSGGVGTDTGKPIAVAEWAGLAVDFAAEKAWVRDATGWAGDPVAGTGNSFSFATIGLTLYAMVGGFTTGDEIEANFGASAFTYTIPSGFIAWGDGTGGGGEEETSEGVAVAAGAGAALAVGDSFGTGEGVGAASGTGGSSVVGDTASAPPLDGLSGITGAWSFSRALLTSFGAGTRYTDSAGKIITLEDQSGNNRDFTDGGDSAQRPDLVTAGPNSRAAAEFNSGESDNVMVGPALSNFISNSTGYFIVSILPDSITLNSANSYANHPVLADGGALMGLFLRTTDTYGYNWDGTDDRAAEGSALSTGTAYVLEWWHTGGNVNLRVNGGTTRTAASGNTTGLTEVLLLGSNDITTPQVYRGKIFEVAAFNAIPSLAERDAMVAAFKAWIGI